MLFGLVLLEALSIGLFAMLLSHLQHRDLGDHVRHRLVFQTTTMALEAEEAFEEDRPDWARAAARMMGDAPNVLRAKITDPAGNVLFVSAGDPGHARLDPAERSAMATYRGHEPSIFQLGEDRWEGMKPIYVGYELRGYAWIEDDPLWDLEQLSDTLRATMIFGTVWILASIALVWLISRVISQPLAILHEGTRALTYLPETRGAFPLPVPVSNELGELIEAFNSMVAALEEQRAGLRDTLSLLDSMLANAPVGFAFFDRELRFTRVNRVFMHLTRIPVNGYLGSIPSDQLPQQVAGQIEDALRAVFVTAEPVHDIEIRGVDAKSHVPWTWLMSAYPVRTNPNQVRWAGIVLRDISERARAEEALRRTEKLAATGRLAASIAHEINNPLEGLTNLLYLLRNFSGLPETALEFVTLAEHQTRRMSDIAQKTLRFHRQSTNPVRARVAELIDSILDLYNLRTHTLDINVETHCDPELTLYCYEGEIRQVLANLIGNAVDATAAGGQLVVRARASHHWRRPDCAGVRITVADTGTGMTAHVKERIFEPFFTTKDATGTGLGLWVSQEIIAKHHGEVRVRSCAASAGRASGTVFEVFLPDDHSLAILGQIPREEHQGAGA